MSSNPSQNKPTNSRKKLKLKQKSNSENSPKNSRYEENEEQDLNANDREEFASENQKEHNDDNKKNLSVLMFKIIINKIKQQQNKTSKYLWFFIFVIFPKL